MNDSFQTRLIESYKVTKWSKEWTILIGGYSDYSYRGLFLCFGGIAMASFLSAFSFNQSGASMKETAYHSPKINC